MKLQMFCNIFLKPNVILFIDYHYCPVKAGKSVFEIIET